jgi:hypothetical protein
MLVEFIKNGALISTSIDKLSDFRSCDFLMTAETTLLSMPEVLDYLKLSEIDNFINIAVSKLAHGGTIKVGGTNIDAVCRGRINGMLNASEVTNLLYGNGSHPWDNKVGAYAPQDIRQKLESLNLNILSYRVSDFKFIIEASRS